MADLPPYVYNDGYPSIYAFLSAAFCAAGHVYWFRSNWPVTHQAASITVCRSSSGTLGRVCLRRGLRADRLHHIGSASAGARFLTERLTSVNYTCLKFGETENRVAVVPTEARHADRGQTGETELGLRNRLTDGPRIIPLFSGNTPMVKKDKNSFV